MNDLNFYDYCIAFMTLGIGSFLFSLTWTILTKVH